jgi:hypothetical protein
MTGAGGLLVTLLFYAMVLYVLYWVIRLGVRHGIGDHRLGMLVRLVPPVEPDEEPDEDDESEEEYEDDESEDDESEEEYEDEASSAEEGEEDEPEGDHDEPRPRSSR